MCEHDSTGQTLLDRLDGDVNPNLLNGHGVNADVRGFFADSVRRRRAREDDQKEAGLDQYRQQCKYQ